MANGCGGSTSVDITQDSPVMDTFLCTEPVHKIDLNYMQINYHLMKPFDRLKRVVIVHVFFSKVMH